MYYKIDLNNYEPREVPEYQEFTNYNDIKWEQIEMIDEELDNFKDSFGKSWSEWTLNNLRNRLKDGWTFYLVEGGYVLLIGIDDILTCVIVMCFQNIEIKD